MATIYYGNESKELGPGQYEAEKGDFPNDQITKIEVNFGEVVTVFQDYGFKGNGENLVSTNPMGPTTYGTDQIGGVSCIRIMG